jgi:hypothetical protein
MSIGLQGSASGNVKFWTLSLAGLSALTVARIVLGGNASKWVWRPSLRVARDWQLAL